MIRRSKKTIVLSTNVCNFTPTSCEWSKVYPVEVPINLLYYLESGNRGEFPLLCIQRDDIAYFPNIRMHSFDVICFDRRYFM